MGKRAKYAIGILLLTGLFSCQSTTNEHQSQEALNPRFDFVPHILWLVAEDMSPNIPAYGDSTIATPALDWLAAEGVVYDNFYTPSPVCAPARAAIITGMYPNSIGAGHMRTGPWYQGRRTPEQIAAYKSMPEGFVPYEAVPPPEVKMFSEILRNSGYFCTNNAKEDYQFIKTPTAWDVNSTAAHWRHRPPNRPFFSVFNFGVTHESRIWAKADDSLWVDEALEVPVPPYLPDTEVGRRDIRRMYSNILEMDSQVGAILDQLKEDGLMDSTIVIWYTDHGGPLPRQKRLLHESGIKVPMIIRFPGKLFAGRRDDRMISFIDLAPTMLSLAGIQPPAYMDGKAFLGPYVRKDEPQYIYAAADRFDETYDRNRAVKDNRFKYIKYFYPEKPMFLHVAYRDQQPIMRELYRLRDQGKLSTAQQLWFRPTKPNEELFDTWNDPHEVVNLADDPQYAERLAEMRAACSKWTRSINDTGLIPEQELISKFWPDTKQPVTADPVITVTGNTVTILSDTPGASIGYQLGSFDDSRSWKVYTKPFQMNGDSHVTAIAHRLGYLPSNINTKPLVE